MDRRLLVALGIVALTVLLSPGYPLDLSSEPVGTVVDELQRTLSSSEAAPTPPTCVYGAREPHVELAYARPIDAADKYAEVAPHLRAVMNEVNGHFIAAGEPFGWRVSLRVLCEPGTSAPVVRHLVLPTSSALDSNATIWRDAWATGSLSHGSKILLHYDGKVRDNLGGENMPRRLDDAPGSGNQNNQESMSIVYGTPQTDASLYLHELLHGMGAVQPTAPHADATGHCWQPGDFLCNAPAPSGAIVLSCSPRKVDCKNDDYFHPEPPAGSYLATHWNLASASNVFVHRERVAAPLLEGA